MERVKRTRDVSAVVLAVGLSAGLAVAEERPPSVPKGATAAAQAPTAEAGEPEHADEAALFLGGTTESDETHFTIGGEYERRLGERFGLGLVAEHVSDTDAWVFMAPFSFRPVLGLGLKLYAGPGSENKVPELKEPPEVASTGAENAERGREFFFVARAGVGWALELGRVSLTPQVELDCVREDSRWDKALVFGVAIGLGF